MQRIRIHQPRVRRQRPWHEALVGGTLGVAVIGSVYASVYGSRLTATMPAAVPGRVAAIAPQSVGAAYVAAGKIAALGHPALGLALQHASTNAFCAASPSAPSPRPGPVGRPVLAVQPAQPAQSAAQPVQAEPQTVTVN